MWKVNTAYQDDDRKRRQNPGFQVEGLRILPEEIDRLR